MRIGNIGRVHFYPDSGLGGGSSISKAMHSRFLSIFRVREVSVTPDLLVSLSNQVFRDNLSFQDARTFLDPRKNSSERLTLCVYTLRFLEPPLNKYRRGNIESLLGYLKKTNAQWAVLTGIKEEREKFINDLNFNFPILQDKNAPTGTIDADLGGIKTDSISDHTPSDKAPVKNDYLTEGFWREDNGAKVFEKYKEPKNILNRIQEYIDEFNKGNFLHLHEVQNDSTKEKEEEEDPDKILIKIAIKIALNLEPRPSIKTKDEQKDGLNQVLRLVTQVYLRKFKK